MKSEIIRLLREAENYVSGQELCNQFTVSRTAIWKVINQLKAEGYQIEAVRNKGYRLIESSDVVGKEAIVSHIQSKQLGCKVVSFDVTDSTNVQAKLLAEQGCPHGTLVVADEQSSGRGRRGRQWISKAGEGIFMSVVLRPTFEPNYASMLTLVMAYSIAKVLERYQETSKLPIDVRIKWPNDIVINQKKLCGILTEMSTEIDYINYVVIGVGINVNTQVFEQEIEHIATSWKKESGTSIHRAQLIGDILYEFEYQYEKFIEKCSLKYLLDGYNSLLINNNQMVRVLDPQASYEGIARGINDVGELLVETTDGSLQKVYAGEVSVRGLYGYV